MNSLFALWSGTNVGRRPLDQTRQPRASRPAFDQLETRELLSPGYFDTTFGADGRTVYNFGGTTGNSAPQGEAVAVLNNGKILVAGPIKTGGAYFSGTRRLINKTSDIGVIRLNANGTIDKTFGHRGEVILSFRSNAKNSDRLVAMSVDPVGRIVLAGTVTQNNGQNEIVVARLNANGSYDTSFGKGGRSYTNFDSLGFTSVNAAGMVIDSSDRIIVAGTLTQPSGQNEFGVIRLGTNGSLDQTFGDQGRVHELVATTDVNDDSVSSVTLDGQGNILVAGSAEGDRLQLFAVTRIRSDGSADPTFGYQGVAILPTDQNFDAAPKVAVNSQGQILLAGTSTAESPAPSSTILTARLTPTGQLDPNYGNSGFAHFAFNGFEFTATNAMEIDSAGKIVIAGFVSGGNGMSSAVVRLNSNGTGDSSFGASGGSVVGFGLGNDYADALTFDSSGKIVMAGGVSYAKGGAFGVERILTS